MQTLNLRRAEGPVPVRRSRAVEPGAVPYADDLVMLDPAGAPIGCQVVLDASPAEHAVRAALPRLQWEATWDGVHGPSRNEYRLSGIVSAHQTFGNVAPMKLRRRFGCATTRFSREHPRLDRALTTLGHVAWEAFAATLPEQAEQHEALVRARILDDWLMDGLPYTSGIINNSAALPYHCDASNIVGTWSLMICLRRGVEGGALHLAEWGTWLSVPDRSVIVFDGQAHLHGVTPMRRADRYGYRYTIVFYAKAGCAGCGPRADEARRAAAVATAHYDERAGQ